MKINSRQIEAIVSEAQKGHNKRFEESRKQLLKSDRILKESKKYADLLNQIPIGVRKHIGIYEERMTAENIASLIVSDLPKPYFDTQEVRNKVILYAIEAKDINELMKKLSLTL